MKYQNTLHYVGFQEYVIPGQHNVLTLHGTQKISTLLKKGPERAFYWGIFLEFLLVRVRIIFAGDDVTDEDAITALKGMAMTFRIVSSHVSIDTNI